MQKNCSSTNLDKLEAQIYKEVSTKREAKIKRGIIAHAKHIPHQSGAPEYVKMYRNAEFDTVISLVSQPFDSYEQAKHFSDCFNDSFLCDSYCVEENGLFYVYSDWLIKHGFMAYSIHSKGRYFEFANWS